MSNLPTSSTWNTPPAQHAADTAAMTLAPLRRAIYIGLGMFFLALGIVGVVLPGIPTTPFLLLMSFFLVRSSPRLHRRVMRLPVVGRTLSDWEEHRGVRPHVKWIAYAMIALAVGILLSRPSLALWLKTAFLPFVAIGVTVVYRLPTVKQRVASLGSNDV